MLLSLLLRVKLLGLVYLHLNSNEAILIETFGFEMISIGYGPISKNWKFISFCFFELFSHSLFDSYSALNTLLVPFIANMYVTSILKLVSLILIGPKNCQNPGISVLT